MVAIVGPMSPLMPKGWNDKNFWVSRDGYEFKQHLENVHIYLWILKDYAWTSDNLMLSWVAGSTAIAWLVGLIGLSLTQQSWEDAYHQVGTLLWLCGNFVWMAGEVGMWGDDRDNSVKAAYFFTASIGWLAVYYVVLRPCQYLTPCTVTTKYYESMGLFPRVFGNYRPFVNFRQYEYLHTLCWVSKDLSWNRYFAWTWIPAFALTFALGMDFIYLTFASNNISECCHYVAQLLWVTANFAWALGEFYYDDHDTPISLAHWDDEAFQTGRWWAQLALVLAFMPGLFCYFVYRPFYLEADSSARCCFPDKELSETTSINPIVVQTTAPC